MSSQMKVFTFPSFQQALPLNIKKFDFSSSNSTGEGSENKAISALEKKRKSKHSETRPGIMFLGICENKECTYEWKWSSLGFGTFNVAQYIWKIPCPDCEKYLSKVQRVVIYQCQLVGKGLPAKDNINAQQEVYFEHSIFQPDSFVLFGQLESQLIKWHYLTLKATKPQQCINGHPMSKTYRKIYTPWKCSKCLEQFSAQQKTKTCCIPCPYQICWNCI